ncbi:NhaP-type Na+ H+ and K+ H+ antiporter [Liquorilactobacillus aquaticus DSM 21051]|uniref:NhaP-type Na+ H+ and K+ H+ antiporter n=1 Tax=Liquorilactobacillus aquaticus DSM 21051 TaxID=1423725 RepID=A0A0R2D8A3_9LACO|nr:sodium:proton antiporter [Liquorilactobacillus aquaticus]KRM96779.1 NhaP-type Na+ H+ and K+ H+ antiporter [Liquorilactobacillus aquaticus DSM 21051]
MTFIYSIILLVTAVILANFIAQKFTAVPQSIWQIILGLLCAMTPSLSNYIVNLDPEWFMMLVIAPLLFFEGQQTQKQTISQNIKNILRLSIMLALITMIIIGWGIHHFLNWPFAIALALAAIVTPTDATALNSVNNGLIMPTKVERSLNLESMFNDATGIVALELAIVWINTGHLSVSEVLRKFGFVALGGIIFGLAAGFFVIQLRKYLLRKQFDDMTAQVLLQLLTPLIIYVAAEKIGVSGIIAAVIAGIIHHEERNRTLLVSAQMNNLITQLWKVITQLLNGVVFVILGLSLVPILKNVFGLRLEKSVGIITIAFLIYAGMLLLRYFYALYDAKRINKKIPKDVFKDALVFSLGGVHGTVTLAMAFSLPLYLANHQIFKVRESILTISALVILFSLIVPLILLPRILPKEQETFDINELDQAYKEIVNAALAYINTLEISDERRQKLTHRIQTQLVYKYNRDPQTWNKVVKELDDVRNRAVENAIEDDLLSADAIKLWHRMNEGRKYKQQTVRGLKNRIRCWHMLYRSWERMLNLFLTDKQKVQYRVRKYRRRIGKLERKKLKATNKEERTYIQGKITKLERKISFVQIYRDDEQRHRWTEALQEIDDVTADDVALFVEKVDEQNSDKGIVIALREKINNEKLNVRTQLDVEAQQNVDLMSILQFELGFIKDRHIEGKYSGNLTKILYDDIIAAQSIILEVGI